MSENLFDTEAKRNAGVAALTQLKEHPGWKLLEAIWDANIEVLAVQLENGSENETKADVDRVRDKLRLLRDIRNTPAKLISDLTPKETTEVITDPYETLDQFQQRRKILEQPLDS